MRLSRRCGLGFSDILTADKNRQLKRKIFTFSGVYLKVEKAIEHDDGTGLNAIRYVA